MSALDDARTLIGAAAASSSRELRILYSGEARTKLATALDELTAMQVHLSAIEAELARTIPPKAGNDA